MPVLRRRNCGELVSLSCAGPKNADTWSVKSISGSRTSLSPAILEPRFETGAHRDKGGFGNQFATELLMPRALVLRAAIDCGFHHAPPTDEDHETFETWVREMAREFDVSRQAMAVRLFFNSFVKTLEASAHQSRSRADPVSAGLEGVCGRGPRERLIPCGRIGIMHP